MTQAPASVVVTGASRGLGEALALRFARPGATVGLIARDRAALARVAAGCAARGAAVRVAAVDVADAAAMAEVLGRWDAAMPVDLAVANAATSFGTGADGMPERPEEAAVQVGVNLLGAMHLLGPLLPGMMARRRGAVGLVASIAAFRALRDSPGYCASKAGLWAWGEALRPALRPHGVAVTLVAPGFFETALGRRFEGPKPLALRLEDVADRTHRALLRRAPRAVFPLPLAALLRGLDLLPAPVVDRAMELFRFRIRPPER